jgi:hypothetical protein
MAKFYATVDLNMKYRPGLAPWRHHELLICTKPGVPLPAGTPFEVPDELAFTVDWDLNHGLIPGGIVWLKAPSTETLEAARQLALRHSSTGELRATLTLASALLGSIPDRAAQP